MSVKPILFNTDMVKAILEGRKTVTRRVVKPQPPATAHVSKVRNDYGWSFWKDNPEKHYMKPPCKNGDVIWVRETWSPVNVRPRRYIYKADVDRSIGEGVGLPLCWHPSIHMPREAARIFLRVKDVRVERLQDIDGLGAFDEGAVAPMPKGCLPPKKPDDYDKWSEGKQNDWIRSMARATYISKLEFNNRLIKAFQKIWDSTINKSDFTVCGWEANPYVWVIEFERCEKPEGWPN